MANPNSDDAVMEVLKRTALAYFARSPAEVKQIAHEVFDKIDVDGNGKITLAEFLIVLDDENDTEKVEVFFKCIDTNGDGTLDFHEFLTFFFLAMSNGMVICDGYGCDKKLVSTYFSCLECHLKTNNSYDLCIDCYRRGNFSHDHSDFLDNFSLLRWYKNNWASQPGDNSEAGGVCDDSTDEVQNEETKISNSPVDQPSLDSTYSQKVNEKALVTKSVDDYHSFNSTYAREVNEMALVPKSRSRKSSYFHKAVKIGAFAAEIGVAGGLCTIL